MLADSSPKPSRSSTSSGTHSPTTSNAQPARKLASEAALPDAYELGGGSGGNLNTSSQLLNSSSPSSKRSTYMSSLVGAGMSGDLKGDHNYHGNSAEPWFSGRSASGTWDDSALNTDFSSLDPQSQLNLRQTRQRQSNAGPFPTLCTDTGSQTSHSTQDFASKPLGTGYSTQPSSYPFSTFFYKFLSPYSVVDDPNTVYSRQQAPPTIPIPPQVCNAQVRSGSSLPQQLYPTAKYVFYPNLGRDTFGKYPYIGPYGSPNPSVYGSGGVHSPLVVHSDVPQNLHPNSLDTRQQPPMYLDYNAAMRPPSQFFFPTPQPMLYSPQSPIVSQLPALFAPVTLAQKKLEIQYKLEQQLAFRNLMLRASPQANGATLNYGSQMLGAAGMYAFSTLSFGQIMRGNCRQDAQREFATPLSPILDEFRVTHQIRLWKLREIAGSVVEFSGDKLGSRFIQDTLPEASNEEKQSVFDEIYPNHTLTLIQNVFGNYVIQKLFQHGTQTQKTALVNSMEGNVVYLSCHLYGCRVIQMAIESILPEQQATFVRELEPHIMRCIKDSNASHVVQKLIEHVSPDRRAFDSSFLGHTFDLATHPSGCRVLQQCLKHLPEVQIRPLLDELLSDRVSTLMQDQFGNYVIQCVLETGRPEHKASVIAELRGRLLFMARHKSASNVCEKALAHADPEVRHALIEEIMGPPSKPDATRIAVMIKDAYGNYVLQRALRVAEGDQQKALVNVIRRQLLNIRSSTYATTYSKRLMFFECELNKFSPSEPS